MCIKIHFQSERTEEEPRGRHGLLVKTNGVVKL